MLKTIEKAFNVAMLFYTTGAVLSFVFGSSDGSVRDEGSVPYLALQLAFYAVAFCFIAMRWRLVLRGAMNASWILALVGIAIASSAWSQDPLFTFRRSLVLLATTLYAIYFGGRFTIAEQLRLLSWTFALVVSSSLFMAILLPHYGVDHGAFFGAWQGAFPQKNMLARAMVLAAAVFYFVRPSALSWIRWIGIAASLVLLAASRSVTGVIVFVLMVAAILLFRLARVRLSFLVPVLSGLGALGMGLTCLVYAGQSNLLAQVGRNTTLTGRTDLWGATLTSILQRPWLGYGFNAFWEGMQGASYSVITSVGWYVRHAHNGFIDLSLDLGMLGLATFVAGYLVLSKRALQIIRRVPCPASYWFCAFLCFMLLYNLDESSILVQNNIFWIVYTSTAVNISTYVRERRLSKVRELHYEF
jgi:exopolysaccharide production protein ExoQ